MNQPEGSRIWWNEAYRDQLRLVEVWWTNPGEGCADCRRPLEVMAGDVRPGAEFFHMYEPDLFCDDCTRRVRPEQGRQTQ